MDRNAEPESEPLENHPILHQFGFGRHLLQSERCIQGKNQKPSRRKPSQRVECFKWPIGSMSSIVWHLRCESPSTLLSHSWPPEWCVVFEFHKHCFMDHTDSHRSSNSIYLQANDQRPRNETIQQSPVRFSMKFIKKKKKMRFPFGMLHCRTASKQATHCSYKYFSFPFSRARIHRTEHRTIH